jgi:hypothetical protein
LGGRFTRIIKRAGRGITGPERRSERRKGKKCAHILYIGIKTISLNKKGRTASVFAFPFLVFTVEGYGIG